MVLLIIFNTRKILKISKKKEKKKKKKKEKEKKERKKGKKRDREMPRYPKLTALNTSHFISQFLQKKNFFFSPLFSKG